MENDKLAVDLLDNKDAAYYKNRFLNSCVMRIKQCNSLPSKFNSIFNIIDALIELELSRDPEIGNRINDLNSLKKDLEHCYEFLQQYSSECQEEVQILRAKDFEQFIQTQNENIRNKIEQEKKEKNND